MIRDIGEMYDIKGFNHSPLEREKVAEFVARCSLAALPGTYLVEFFPWMRYIPSSIAKWKRVAEEHHAVDSVKFMSLYEEVENRVVSRLFFARWALVNGFRTMATNVQALLELSQERRSVMA